MSRTGSDQQARPAPPHGDRRGWWRLRAHAKVNLALRVGPRGVDGYHSLATVFQTVSLADVLFVGYARAPAPGRGGDPEGARHAVESLVHLTVEGTCLPDDNTVVCAVQRLAACLHRPYRSELPCLRVHLVKRIPAGAGLGGGSSDAAAVLMAAARLWGVDGLDAGRRTTADRVDLAAVAAAVGADVPFFLTGGTALGTGRGTEIESLPPLDPTWLVLAAPDLEVPTAEAYAAFDANGVAPGGSAIPRPPYRPSPAVDWMGNDLAAPVIDRFPDVEHTRRQLLRRGARIAQMTGSGAASFGVFDDRRAAVDAARAIRGAGCWAAAATSVDAAQHLRSLQAGSPG